MANIKYNVTLNFSNILTAADELEHRVSERISQGVERAAQAIRLQWQQEAGRARGIWAPQKQAYVESITWHPTGKFSAVVETTLPLADEIENGRPAKDLKRMLDSSTKVRQGKKGRYLIIPFRHNTPGGDGHSSYAPQMPKNIYAKAKNLSATTITGVSTRVSGTGAMNIKTRKPMVVAQNKYKWGGKLPEGLAPKLKPHHAADPYAGMTRFNTSSGKQKSSAYLTFRIMSENQTGKWIIPAKPGLHIARAISAEVNKAVQDGIEQSG